MKNLIEAPNLAYDIGIVHLGLGAFHRAHQAAYLTRYAKRSGDTAWGLCSANLRSSIGLVDGLREAGHRYHVAEYADRDDVSIREIDVIQETLFSGRDDAGNSGRDLEALLARLSSPQVRIVSLTVTEKGYFLNPASGELLVEDPMIAAEIASPQVPRTAPGLLVEALVRRRAAGLPPFTVLSCDNMPDNGRRTRNAVVQLAAFRDPELADWIQDKVAFPCSMVDRIVPAMTEADFARLDELGVNDPHAVVCEAFSQWVIEDDFPQGRPDWEQEGVQMVEDVTPFETMKLRMLNGSHSLLAYLGAIDGIETVYDAVGRRDLRALLLRYMRHEAAPTLSMPDGVDLDHYAERLLARFANGSLRHRLQQIAMDGSQKLPQRWLHGALSRQQDGQDIPCTALGMAAWIHYTSGRTLQGQAHEVSDPLAARFAALHERHSEDPESLVAAFLALNDIVPPSLATHADFAQAVTEHYRSLTQDGLAGSLRMLEQA